MGRSVGTARRARSGMARLARVFTLLLALPVALAVAVRCADARALSPATHAAASAAASSAAKTKLSKVTIEASRLRHQVDHFVTSVLKQPPSRESLLRWDKPVCPLIVGLPRNMGEFILRRISQAARDAYAPLAGRHCEANLFIVVTPHPDHVLKQWMARDPQVNTRHGVAPLDRFLHSRQPVRVWYNAVPGCPGGSSRSASSGSSAVSVNLSPDKGTGTASPNAGMGPVYCQNGIDTHLTYGEIRSIAYAIVVANTRKLTHVTIGQLADYVSLVGLADIRPRAEGSGVPTILRLFRGPAAPQGMTPWDRALLYSLYNTSQSGRLQLTNMEVMMTRRIAP